MLNILLFGLTACFGPECSADGDCAETQICDDVLDECVSGCRTDEGCPTEYICDDVLDECIYGCRTDDDCDDDEECDEATDECRAKDANAGN